MIITSETIGFVPNGHTVMAPRSGYTASAIHLSSTGDMGWVETQIAPYAVNSQPHARNVLSVEYSGSAQALSGLVVDQTQDGPPGVVAVITLTLDGAPFATTTSAPDGTWSTSVADIASGAHQVVAVATNGTPVTYSFTK